MRYSCLFIFLALFVCIKVNADNIKKGDIDHRIYHLEKLSNELNVLLISDSKAEKAAASLNVNVGSYNDPNDRPGLAHFLEHMLFLGTKKYPSADEYQAFISDNGGSHNAFTSSYNTNYFFDVDNKQLESALDRFSQFFIHPLFDSDYVDRERNAVHSEYQAKLQDDSRRSFDVYRSIVNPQHPASKFTVGSIDTLSNRPNDLVRDDLIEFYTQYYSSHKMNLVVLGNYSIDGLKKIVEQRFSAIPKRKTTIPSTAENVPRFLFDQLPLEVLSKPVKELRQMSLSFQLPSIKQYYKEKPLDFIAYLIGHEGSGSLLSLLKSEGLVEGLSAGAADNEDDTGTFYITFQLTKEGVNKRDVIRKMTFYVIDQIKQKGVEFWRYEEKQLLSNLAFRFRENAKPISTVVRLSSNLNKYSVEDVIVGDYLLEKYDEELIKRFLSYLSPKTLLVTSIFPEVKTDKVSTYYNVPYSISSLKKASFVKTFSQKQTQFSLPPEWLSKFTLPEKNPFIPRDTQLFSEDKNLNEVVQYNVNKKESKQKTEIWVKQDLSFKVPKMKANFRILSPEVSKNIKGAVLSSLYTELIKDQLNEFNYPALLAGAGVFVSATNRGIDITAQGYHDRLHVLAKALVDEMGKASFDHKRFEQIKSDLLRNWRNSDKKTPYHQLYNQLVVDIYSPYWRDSEKASVLEEVTIKDVNAFAKNWRLGATLSALFYGNVSSDLLLAWKDVIDSLTLEGHYSVSPASVGIINSIPTQYINRIVEHNDQAAILYVQGVDDSLKSQAAMLVLRQMMQSPFYSSLRTEQQLGYIVFMGALNLKEVPGSVFVVQSPGASVDKIRSEIHNFIDKYQNQIPDDIAVYKQAVLSKLLESPTSLSAAANEVWADVVRGDDKFNYKKVLSDAVSSITSKEVKSYYAALFQESPRQVWVYSKGVEDLKGQTPLALDKGAFVYP